MLLAVDKFATLDAARRSGHTWADHIDCDPKDCTVAHLARAVLEPSGLDVDRLARAFVSAGMLQREWTERSGPPWPSVSPYSWAMTIACEYAALSTERSDESS